MLAKNTITNGMPMIRVPSPTERLRPATVQVK